ncbi:MAG: pitrilysin family protein [Acidobacteriaceae bacterium]
MFFRRISFSVALVLLGTLPGLAAGPSAVRIPLAMHTLKNGLKIVVSEDHSSPIFGVCVAYGVGFRLEPPGRTGFAHLFEHMMFEGTPDAPKGVFSRVVEGAGGSFGADTRYDRTQFVEAAPLAALDDVFWLEADRMKTLAFSQKTLDNQRNVVKEEVRTNVLNKPYGLFYVLDLPGKAFDRFPNNHNFYGDFHDLNAATVSDVRGFYEQYYAPNNAVVVVVGDVNPKEIFAKAEKYFGGIPRRDVPPHPDVAEAPQERERQQIEHDPLAKLPAFAIGYRMPAHGSHLAIVAAVTGEMLHNGNASLLYQSLVAQKKVAVMVSGGLDWPLGNPYEYNGPTLMTSLIMSPPGTTLAQVLPAYDGVIDRLATDGPSAEELQRVLNKMRSDLIDQFGQPMERASMLAEATLYDGNPDAIDRIPGELAAVTPLDVKEFAQKYLVSRNRTIIERLPASHSGPQLQSGKKAGKP